VLADLGVRTFGDLRADDPGAQDDPRFAWRLVVTASDVSRRRLARFPWDFPDYGLDPDEQEVARAVQASAAIPFFFEPVTLRPAGRAEPSLLLDGGLLSNFPVGLFDRTDGRVPRWPTFGVRLSARPPVVPETHDVHGPVALGLAVVATLVESCDARHVDDPCVVRRTVFVDTHEVSAIDFDLDAATRERLMAAGGEAAREFVASWDLQAYLRECRELTA
jgi:NTE family protein